MKYVIAPCLMGVVGILVLIGWMAPDTGVVREVLPGSHVYATFHRDEATGSLYQLERDGTRIYDVGTPEWAQRMRDRGLLPKH